MRIKARGDLDWFLLSPEFTDIEAKKVIGRLGLTRATGADLSLEVFEMPKEDVLIACKKVDDDTITCVYDLIRNRKRGISYHEKR